jgi:hypothetical protein
VVKITVNPKLIGPKIAQRLANNVTANNPNRVVMVRFRTGIPNSFEKLIPKLAAVTKIYNQLNRISAITSNN